MLRNLSMDEYLQKIRSLLEELDPDTETFMAITYNHRTHALHFSVAGKEMTKESFAAVAAGASCYLEVEGEDSNPPKPLMN